MSQHSYRSSTNPKGELEKEIEVKAGVLLQRSPSLAYLKVSTSRTMRTALGTLHSFIAGLSVISALRTGPQAFTSLSVMTTGTGWKKMVTAAVLGAATGTGLALVVAMTIVVYRYYILRKKDSDWGDLERFDTRHLSRASYGGKGQKGANYSYGKSPSGSTISSGKQAPSSPYRPKSPISRWDSRGSRTSTKSCPPLYTYPQQEFNVNQVQRIIQPLQSSFTSLPEVRESCGNLIPPEDMLTHQSRSLPSGPPIPGARLNRTPSISSQGHIEQAVRKGHRGSSPAIRTFTPEGLSSGVSPPDSPPLTYMGSRSPSPLHIRTASLEMKNGSPSSSTADLRSQNADEPKTPTQSQSSLNSLTDRPPFSCNSHRRASRCLSPLLIPPKSPTLSDASSQSPGPVSPLLGSLQLDLYQKKDVTVFLPTHKQPGFSPSDKSGPLGRLHFRLKYELDKSDLHVHVIEAHDLAGSDQGGFNDPYIRLFLSPEVDGRKRHTSIHRNDPNPFFDEHFKFPVSQDELKDKTLILQVFDYDRYSRNDVVGEISMRLDEFNVTTNTEVWAEVVKNKKPSGERQEILISLSYLPSAERLTVVLLKARNLYSPPNKDTIDPFVKVYLVGGGKRLKKKKTSARKHTNNPVWNEAVSFSIPSSMLSTAAIEICVLDQSNDLMGTSALVGSCIIGPRETGTELNHWQNMTQNFRKSIASWHVLI